MVEQRVGGTTSTFVDADRRMNDADRRCKGGYVFNRICLSVC